jgi:Bacterial extracellular solute-binding proteins, family 3
MLDKLAVWVMERCKEMVKQSASDASVDALHSKSLGEFAQGKRHYRQILDNRKRFNARLLKVGVHTARKSAVPFPIAEGQAPWRTPCRARAPNPWCMKKVTSSPPFTRTADPAADNAPATLLGRMLGMLRMIASIMIIASFTAGITSRMAAQRLESAVRTSADLSVVRTGSVNSTAAFDSLRGQHVDVRNYPDVTAGLEALKDGKLDAFVYDRPILEWNVRKGFIDDVTVLDKIFSREDYAIALPENSALRAKIDIAMVDELRGAWWQDLVQRYLGRD